MSFFGGARVRAAYAKNKADYHCRDVWKLQRCLLKDTKLPWGVQKMNFFMTFIKGLVHRAKSISAIAQQ